MGPSTALKFRLRRSQIQRGQEASALNRNAASTLASHNPQRVRSGDRLSLGIDNVVSVLADWELRLAKQPTHPDLNPITGTVYGLRRRLRDASAPALQGEALCPSQITPKNTR